jgi:hypothetical protein
MQAGGNCAMFKQGLSKTITLLGENGGQIYSP